MAFQYRKDPLSLEEAFIHLENFDLNDKIHVDMIEKPEGGQLYMFFLTMKTNYVSFNIKKELLKLVFLRGLKGRWN
jgi:hypothetical protein